MTRPAQPPTSRSCVPALTVRPPGCRGSRCRRRRGRRTTRCARRGPRRRTGRPRARSPGQEKRPPPCDRVTATSSSPTSIVCDERHRTRGGLVERHQLPRPDECGRVGGRRRRRARRRPPTAAATRRASRRRSTRAGGPGPRAAWGRWRRGRGGPAAGGPPSVSTEACPGASQARPPSSAWPPSMRVPTQRRVALEVGEVASGAVRVRAGQLRRDADAQVVRREERVVREHQRVAAVGAGQDERALDRPLDAARPSGEQDRRAPRRRPGPWRGPARARGCRRRTSRRPSSGGRRRRPRRSRRSRWGRSTSCSLVTTSPRSSHGPVGCGATARPIAEVREPNVDADQYMRHSSPTRTHVGRPQADAHRTTRRRRWARRRAPSRGTPR